MEVRELEVASFVELRFVHINSITGASTNETVTFEKIDGTDSFVVTSGATQIKRGPKKERKEEYPIEDERLAIAWKHQVYRILLHSAGGRGMKLELK